MTGGMQPPKIGRQGLNALELPSSGDGMWSPSLMSEPIRVVVVLDSNADKPTIDAWTRLTAMLLSIEARAAKQQEDSKAA